MVWEISSEEALTSLALADSSVAMLATLSATLSALSIMALRVACCALSDCSCPRINLIMYMSE
ncbi:MAG: hypothetical protein ACFFBP_21640 [Promethearchaeota archaeon]